MGTHHHHALIVTSFDKEALAKAHSIATDTSPHVTEIVAARCNGFHSFAVLPDGSKEGWADSDVGDAARKAIISWIDAQAYEDGSNLLEWAEVAFGELEPSVKTNSTPADQAA